MSESRTAYTRSIRDHLSGNKLALEAVDGIPTTTDKGLFQCHPSMGGHEVIIESPRHLQSFTELDRSEAALVFVAFRDRIRFWRQQTGIRYISVFKNAGPQAGASLSHCHSQLIATSHLPARVEAVARAMNRHQAKTGCCLQCDLIRGEVKAKLRVVARTDSLIAYCPFASRLPMLVRITTVDHIDRYESLPLRVIEELSHLVSRVTTWLQQLHPGVSYNLILHTRPPGVEGNADAHHWCAGDFPEVDSNGWFRMGQPFDDQSGSSRDCRGAIPLAGGSTKPTPDSVGRQVFCPLIPASQDRLDFAHVVNRYSLNMSAYFISIRPTSRPLTNATSDLNRYSVTSASFRCPDHSVHACDRLQSLAQIVRVASKSFTRQSSQLPKSCIAL